MGKQLLYGDEARRALLKGVEKMARAVKVTLGPKGRSVGLDRKFGAPLIINSGVIVAKDIELDDPFENMGAQMVREVAQKTSESAGDGTTTATILTEAIYREGLKNVTAGANPMALKRGIEAGVAAVINELKKLSRKIETNNIKEVEQVATISANGEGPIGKIIAQAIDKVGKDGVITVEEGKSLTMELKLAEGMQFDQGFLSPYFATNLQKMECELEDPWILIYEKKIVSIKEILPLLEKVAQSTKPLLVIAEDVDGEALATMVINKIRGIFSCAAVKAPGYGDRRKSMLEDIAVLTGGKALTEELGIKLENVTLNDLGRARKIKIDHESTTIIEGLGKKKDIEDRIGQIKGQIKTAASTYEKEQFQQRLAKIAGGVAIIKVGAATETEMKERKSRVEDALHATRAAVEEGIVPGGGVALLRTMAALEKLDLQGDEKTGAMIIKRALEEPVRQLAYNAGLEGSVIVERLKQEKTNVGYDINKDIYVDMLESGVVDPAKVTRLALQNASSIAALLLTTEALVSWSPQKENEDTPLQ